jgi:hypothetical protein
LTTTVTADNARPLTIAQLILSVAGLLLLLSGIIGVAIMLLVAPAAEGISGVQVNQLYSLLWILFAAMLLTIPSLVSSIRRLGGKPQKPVSRRLFIFSSIALIMTTPLVFLAGYTAASGSAQWLIGLLNVLIVIIPLWWFLELGRLQLSRGSAQRQWGVSTFSIFVTLPVVIIVELVVLGFGVLLAAVWLLQQPEFAPLLQQVQQGLFNGSFDPQSLTIDWMSLLQRPAVVGAVLLAAVLVVPLIEELLKPLGVWVLRSRGLSPAGGFTAGMICGAIFALLESLFSLSAISGEEWLYTVVGRVGTGLLHLALTGFNGWALAASWRDGRYLRIGITYILTVLVHGAWNLFAMLMGLNMVGDELELNVNPVLTASAPWVLAALAFAILAALFLLNRHLRHAQTPISSPPPLPVTTERLE